MCRSFQTAAVCTWAAALIWVVAAQTEKQGPENAPEQPIPYSHKLHAGSLKLECSKCHVNPDPGESMGIPAASICMQCHASIATDSPAIQKLSAFAKNKREIRWVRIYEIPTYVRFSHRAHIAAGGTCADCHGQVKERERLYKETNISMSGCISCHREKKAGTDCTFCHESRQQD